MERIAGGRFDGAWISTQGEEAAWKMLRSLEEQQQKILQARKGRNPWGGVIAEEPPWLNGFRMRAVLADQMCFVYERSGSSLWGSPSMLLYGWSETHLLAKRTVLEVLQEQW